MSRRGHRTASRRVDDKTTARALLTSARVALPRERIAGKDTAAFFSIPMPPPRAARILEKMRQTPFPYHLVLNCPAGETPVRARPAFFPHRLCSLSSVPTGQTEHT